MERRSYAIALDRTASVSNSPGRLARLRRSYMDTLNFALDLDSSSVEALRDFCAAVLSQNKHLLFARLKTPAQQVLTRAALPGLPTAALCALSVDDAVKITQELYPAS